MVKWQFWIDRGGTFTDVVARDPDGRFTTAKLLSENPERYADAAIAGIKTVLGLPLDADLPADRIDQVRMGTTIATNALLERKGERTLLIVDEGFENLLRIGHQARPQLFDLAIRKPEPLYDAVEEIGGRIAADGETIVPLDEAGVTEMFDRRHAEGFGACAIALVHAWKFPTTEQRVAALARGAGFTQVSVSHEVGALMGLVSRAGTTVIDAYLSPVLRRYVDRLAGELGGTRLSFLQSNGGLTDASRFRGKDAILSGPAGGIVGAARTAEAAGFNRIIGFDMGGTSTDVALYAGAFERTIDAEIAGVEVRVPMMAINTVAAGGGSILTFDGSRFRVGPESAGANPGPACYRRGGPLTVTDANLLLGRLQPEHFPAIFGAQGDQPLDRAIVEEKFAALAGEVSAAGHTMTSEAVAAGFLEIANANMAAAIRQVSLEKGHDATEFALVCFGGAGGQHACAVADALGMETVLIHPFAGVLSAYGMGLADRSAIRQQAIERRFDGDALAEAKRIAERLESEAKATLDQDGGPIRVTVDIALRYAGSDSALVVPLDTQEKPLIDAIQSAFHGAHRRRFGFVTASRALVLESVTVEVVREGEVVRNDPPRHGEGDHAQHGGGGLRQVLRQNESPLLHAFGAPPTHTGEDFSAIATVPMWCGGEVHPTPIFDRAAIQPSKRLTGPAIIREATGTIVVEPGWSAEMEPGGQLIVRRIGQRDEAGTADDARADPVKLELFNNLFMAVAEQMGAVLRNTSTSVNIKERLDFSCALFDAEGRLIANAPHVPVHLGAMGESVRTVLRSRRGRLKPGDMIVLNDPFNGGTHLPDVTVVAPVFDDEGKEIRFFVGNRGHHADIGGKTPGSMPPDSATLDEEGVVIDDVLLLDGGEFREEGFRALLTGARFPARSPDVNIADIKAQIAANEAGIAELGKVVAHHGWPRAQAYMGHVLANAEESIRRVIDALSDGSFDYPMDGGALLRVTVRVDHAARSAVIDFAGTDAQRPGNFNAPPAVTRAVVLYVFRCLVGADLPLNEGCFAPLEIRVPEGSFLAPAPGSAVVAGNTEVSQAVACALLGALGASASAQGTMNNLLFGNACTQYYETICGGAGAGPGFDGASAVHTHMTNTRITDPEILETRYPVRLERFAIRHDSGGEGAQRGGDGVIRAVRMLEPMIVTLVASRRTVAPFGLAGGGDGAPGRQYVERADGSVEPLAGTAEIKLGCGDRIVIETPGGGGYGAP